MFFIILLTNAGNSISIISGNGLYFNTGTTNDTIIKSYYKKDEQGRYCMQVEDLTKIIMNPTRMRIVQYLMLHENATTRQIRGELADIPKASLYRQMKVLEDANLIHVIQENRVRGAVEKVYELNKESPVGKEPSQKDVLQIINSSLLSLMGEFNRYFMKSNADPIKDYLFLSTSTLLLSDEEFKDFTGKMGELYNQVLQNKARKDRKIRRITMISSPSEE